MTALVRNRGNLVHCDNCGFEGPEGECGTVVRAAKVVPPRFEGFGMKPENFKDVGFRCPKCSTEFGFEAQ